MTKLTASQIVYKALVWAEESMEEMVRGSRDENGRKVADELKQLRAYRKKRFGQPKDPFEGVPKINVITGERSK